MKNETSRRFTDTGFVDTSTTEVQYKSISKASRSIFGECELCFGENQVLTNFVQTSTGHLRVCKACAAAVITVLDEIAANSK